MNGNEKIIFCIVEDNDNFREALGSLINLTPGYFLGGSFSNAEIAIRKIPSIQPNIVLVDINLPGSSGIDCIATLKSSFPEMLFLICTAYEDDEKIFNSLKAGASGYILKSEGPDGISNAIKDLLAGGGPMSSSIARKVINSFNAPETKDTGISHMLTQKERIVLEYMAKGMMNKQVANAMKISVFTVHTHIQNIYAKLHVNTRIEAINMYLKR